MFVGSGSRVWKLYIGLTLCDTGFIIIKEDRVKARTPSSLFNPARSKLMIL